MFFILCVVSVLLLLNLWELRSVRAELRDHERRISRLERVIKDLTPDPADWWKS